jgi:GH35 family endo-1,4-beta-xylanase
LGPVLLFFFFVASLSCFPGLAMRAQANMIFFGGINDPNIGPFPDPLMWGPRSLGLYNLANTNYSDLQYAIQTDLNSFNWTSFDALTTLVAQRGLQRIWYGGYMGAVTNKWLGNFPAWTGTQIVQATTNFFATAAARTQNIQYINLCNEGILDPSGRFQQAWGGAGVTGYDWYINFYRMAKQYFPNAKIGFNDFGIETAGASDPRGLAVRNPEFVVATKVLVANNAIDWVGFEGYDLQQISTTDLTNALNNIGECGVHVIMTEFTPDGYQVVSPSKVLADWQRVFPIYYNSPYVWGVIGPWGWRRSWNWLGETTGWFIDDSVNPPSIEPVVPWLQSILASIIGGGNPSPVSTPTPTPSPGVASYVQGNYSCPQAPQTGVSVSFASSEIAGDMNVVVIGWNDVSNMVVSVNDSQGNTYLAAAPAIQYPAAGTPLSQAIYVAPKIHGGLDTITVLFSGPAIYPDIRIGEYGNIDTLGENASASGTSATASSGTVTPANPELLISAVTTAGGIKAAGSGFTLRMNTKPDGDSLQDRIISGATADSASLLGSSAWVSQEVNLSKAQPTPTPSFSPTPTPAPSATPAPTATPAASPTPVPSPIPAPVAFVQQAYANPQTNSSSVTVSFSSAENAGDANVVMVGWNDAVSSVSSVTDSAGNTYSCIVPVVNYVAGSISQAGYFAPNIQGGADSVTVKFSTAVPYADIRIAEYSGVAQAGAYSSAEGLGTAVASPAITPSTPKLLISAVITNMGVTQGGNGYTVRVITPDGDLFQDRIVSAAGSYSDGATLNVSAYWLSQLVNLFPGPGPTPTATPTPAPTPTSNPGNFPFRADSTGRFTTKVNGEPLPIIGDSPQTMLGKLSEADMDTFMANRAKYGINALWVTFTVTPYVHGSANGATYDGILPFTAADLTTQTGNINSINPAYLQRVDDMIAIAAKYGITIVLDVYDTGGLPSLAPVSGNANCYAYGQALGNHYKNTPNLIWMIGNDFTYFNTDTALNGAMAQIMAGIKSVDPNHLFTIELTTPTGAHDDSLTLPYTTLGSSYTYNCAYAELLTEYAKSPFLPGLLIESNYEGENVTGATPSTPLNLRRQEYWTATSGAGPGQFYGNHNTWDLSSWQENLDTTGSIQLGYLVKFLNSIAWQKLQPDTAHTWVTSGYGTYSSTDYPPQDSYVTTSVAGDGSLMVSYLPRGGSITVNMSKFAGPVTAQWYDPSANTWTAVTGGPFANSGAKVFTSPPANQEGSPDFVLVLTAGAN